MYKVNWNSNVRKKIAQISGKSRLSFNQSIAQLKKDGCLPEEISLAGDHLFRFQIDNDWFATAQRQEIPTWWGQQTFKIEVLELTPVAELEESNSLAWVKKATKVIPPLAYTPYLLPILGVISFVAIALFAVAYDYQGKIDIKTETDGTKVNSEVTIDGRQSH